MILYWKKAQQMKKKNNDPEYLKRNALYSSLLETYIVNYNKKASRKNKYKFAFFIVTMLTFIAIILLSIITIVHMAKKDTTTIYDMSVVFGSVASFITAIVVLPKIIAEHLFPVNEDENMISLVKNMQLNDSEIRKKLK